MAECAYCKAETDFYGNGTPICLRCATANDGGHRPPVSEREIREVLQREVFETTARTNAAAEEFNYLLKAIPSAIPYPDGSLRIRQASRELSAARTEMLEAHSRLDDFLSRGIIPKNLKRSDGAGQ